ncbi:MAG: hypothetical protein QNJ98_14640 [Planctomycetota bacterium]|nr:hypothetical protein [Planctomycetota bacterium]
MRPIRTLVVAFVVCMCAAHASAEELDAPAVRDPLASPPAPAPLPVIDAEADAAARAYAAADGAQPIRRARTPVRDIYHPSMPMGETRSAWTAPAVSPTPFSLTAGEAMTPLRGRVALNITRISDERFMVDNQSRRWDSDGEVRSIQLEVVSPRRVLSLGGLRIPVHVSASLHAYTLNHALFEGLRNWVEENLLGASDDVLDNHDTGGKDLIIDGQDLLGSTPMWKLRFGVKVPLPRQRIGCYSLFSSVSVGLTLPAFGSSTDAGNEDLQPDVTLAWALPFSRKVWLTGAATVSAPGSSERFDELGIETEDVLANANLNLEYWISPCFGAGIGLQYQTSYLAGTGLSLDENSVYFNIGLFWRPHPRHTIHLVWSENPEGEIVFGSANDFDDAQKDADFTFLLGWRYSL